MGVLEQDLHYITVQAYNDLLTLWEALHFLESLKCARFCLGGEPRLFRCPMRVNLRPL